MEHAIETNNNNSKTFMCVTATVRTTDPHKRIMIRTYNVDDSHCA